MQNHSLFRKSSLDRISNPEQLNDYLIITKPGVWGILIGMLAIIIAACIWAFAGTIPETVKVDGVAFSTDSELSVYAYLPLSTAKRMKEGMPVQVSPDYAPREEYGFIYGTVQSIGSEPVTTQDILGLFGSASYVAGLIPEGNVVEVKITLEYGDASPLWSNVKGSAVVLEKGAYCSCLVVIRERKPFELIF